MSTDTSPLKYMGTQSRETVAMEAALAQGAVRSTGVAAEQALGVLPEKVEDLGRESSPASGKIGDAADWALGKAKGTLQSAAGHVRDRATTAVATYIKEDPVRAILIAAGTGALLMGLLSMMAKSGAKTVKRKVRRSRL